ncbi:MAG: hypothetical protein M3521_02470 [Acidobacteriota bacterium]|nr:hypothetical protein [Acidobacteriota bacterium]
MIYRRTDNPIGNLWRQNIAGGEPQQFTDFKSEAIFNYVFTRDGKNILISRGSGKGNVVMLKNFIQPAGN